MDLDNFKLLHRPGKGKHLSLLKKIEISKALELNKNLPNYITQFNLCPLLELAIK